MGFFKKQDNGENARKTTRTQRIEAGKIHAQLYFQNPPNEERVKQIVDSFDWNKFQPLDVSFRNDKFNVIDGQNRLTAIIQKFGDNCLVPCYVRYGLSEVEEMELFVSLAQDRRHVPPMEIYKAWYGSGRPIVVDMVDTIRKVGLVFDFKSGQKNGRINCPVTVMKIIDILKVDDFYRFMNLISKSWNGDKLSLQKEFIDAMFLFFKTHSSDIEDDRFIQSFVTTTKKAGTTAATIRAKGSAFALKSLGIAQAIRFFYNKSTRSLDKKLQEVIMK